MIQLTVNGKARRFEGDPEMPLLWFLRDELQLTGTKFGCGLGLCGACTILAHAPMQPPAAVAEFKDGKVVTYANTQNPQAVQATVATALGITKDDVTCHVTLVGRRAWASRAFRQSRLLSATQSLRLRVRGFASCPLKSNWLEQMHFYLRSILTMSLLVVLCVASSSSDTDGGLRPAQLPGPIPDFSGLAWVEGDTFLALHDAKYPEEKDRVRASLIRLPRSLDGITLMPLALDWPSPQGPSSDLESIARIPGTNSFLLTESGEERDDRQQFRRVFLTELRNGTTCLSLVHRIALDRNEYRRQRRVEDGKPAHICLCRARRRTITHGVLLGRPRTATVESSGRFKKPTLAPPVLRGRISGPLAR